MPFNWFKRQFGNKQDEAPAEQDVQSAPVEKEDSAPAVETASTDDAESTSPTEDTTPANAQDYLAWAKAAYQNIQQQTEIEEAGEAEAETEAETEAEGAGEAGEATEAGEDVGWVDDRKPNDAPEAPEASEEAIADESPVDESPVDESLVDESLVDEATTEDVTVDPTPSEAVATEIEESVGTEDTALEEQATDEDTTAGDLTAEAVTETIEDEVTEPEPEPEPEAATDVEPSPEETTDVATESEAESVTEAIAPEQTPDAVAPETATDETVTTVTEDSPAEAPVTPEPITALASDASPATPTPFWAKAEAERQERLERLKETAIEDEPDPTQAPEADVEFDDDFVWSAGVLASQGRRPDEVSVEEITWLTKLRQGLGKTRRGLINQLKSVVGQGPLNEEAVMEIESLLLQADVGIDATDYVIEALQNRMKEGALPPEEAIAYLKDILRGILDKPFESDYDPDFVPEKDCLNIWMLTGVNGAGKTTTIGKLAHMTRSSDYNCLIAAADTFRAAAVEQVKVWGDRSGVDVIANPGKNTDPAAVVFDAITAAQARDVEVLLVDTAGRLQNKKNLMAELSKIRRIVDKKASNAKVESLLVLDATLGQNGLRQAQVFSEAAKLSGVVLTKLDGSAKGGVALAVVQQLGLPIRFIGAGEGIEDLRPFSSYEFVEALLSG